uniref:EF-hand domain-containing protein n=1 Tax=Lotharella globosa TaxID=91324 RepID=A0A7S3Z7C2_9EUKA
MANFYQDLLETFPVLFECKAATLQDDEKDKRNIEEVRSRTPAGSKRVLAIPNPPKTIDQELAELKEVFAHFDRNGTGSIGLEDMREIMQSVGQHPSDDELKDIVNDLDLNGNGEIEFCEFLGLVGAIDDEDIRDSFRAFDQNDDGVLSGLELKHLMGVIGKDLNERQIQRIINEMDDDGTGTISYKAFSKMMKE